MASDSDEQIIRLLTDIRDAQQEEIAYRREAIGLQKRAIRTQKITVTVALILLLFLFAVSASLTIYNWFSAPPQPVPVFVFAVSSVSNNFLKFGDKPVAST